MRKRAACPHRSAALQWLRPGWIGAGVLLLAAAWWPAGAQDKPSARGGAALIRIQGPIDEITRESIERRLNEATSAGVEAVIFRLDTPGGGVGPALAICRMIKTLPSELRTVAWVDPMALSAGAMISVACQEIWMSPASSIGDSAPIIVGPAGMAELGDTERAKVESPILQEYRDSAARHGHDPVLLRAMVTLSEEVWWLESVADPAVRKIVDGARKKELLDDVAAEERAWRLVRNFRLPWWDDDRDPLPVRQPIDGDGDLLTLSQYDAVGLGLARGIARSPEELLAKLEITGPLLSLEQTGWEKFAAWLNSPLVRGALLVIAMIGLYMEFQSPGLILPGATALIAGAIFIAAPYAAGLGNVWALALIVLGLILIAVELFVLPGFGLAGILGAVSLLAGIVGTFIQYDPQLPTFSPLMWEATRKGLATGFQVLLGSMAVALVGILMLIKVLPETRMVDGIILSNPELVGPDPSDPQTLVGQIGDVGVVVGTLRPSGQARFGQELVDVTALGEYVEAGQRVQVVRRSGKRIEVRVLPDQGLA